MFCSIDDDGIDDDGIDDDGTDDSGVLVCSFRVLVGRCCFRVVLFRSLSTGKKNKEKSLKT